MAHAICSLALAMLLSVWTISTGQEQRKSAQTPEAMAPFIVQYLPKGADRRGMPKQTGTIVLKKAGYCDIRSYILDDPALKRILSQTIVENGKEICALNVRVIDNIMSKERKISLEEFAKA